MVKFEIWLWLYEKFPGLSKSGPLGRESLRGLQTYLLLTLPPPLVGVEIMKN